MRIESSVTSISWIPSEAVTGMTKLPFDVGIGHYDVPPPDVIDDLGGLRAADRFRFANELRAWIEVEGGRVVDYGHEGGGHIGSTTLRLVGRQVAFQAVPLPDLRPEPEVASDSVRFVQTAGGRTGVPAPRHVNHPPFVQLAAPLAWTTLALTIHANGDSEYDLVGASPFPRHWIYGQSGGLVAKSGTIDFKEWYRNAFGSHSPWGEEDAPAVLTAAETALERQLSLSIMGGRRPEIRTLPPGATLVNQGEPGRELFLLLDGVLVAEVDGKVLAEIGPGAILGERALLEGGTRTATLRAVTTVKVAVADGDSVDRAALAKVSEGHRREEE